MNNTLNIAEALQLYYDLGGDLEEQEIATFIWPDKTQAVAATLLSQWKNNGFRVYKIEPDAIRNLCRVLDTTPNFLFRN